MALKTVLETLDGVDDAIKPLYTETEGRFVLDVEGVDAHPDVANLKSAYERVKAAEKDAKAAAKKAADDLATALKDKPDETAMLNLRQTLETERDEWKSKAETYASQLTGVTRDQQIAGALTEAGITNPAFVKAASMMLADKVKLVDGKAVAETDMGPLAVTDFVKRWAAGEGAAFVAAPAGGGAKGNGSGHTAPMKRSDMTPEQKHAYQAEHGQAAYLKLPK